MDEFETPRADWLELWQGPLQFRATLDRGVFGPGHTIEQMHEFADDGATGGKRHEPIWRVRVDPVDGAISIEWLVHRGVNGRTQTLRFYDGLDRKVCDRLREDLAFRAEQFRMFGLFPEHYERAGGAFAIAVSIQEWLRVEFRNAIHAGQCEIWARAGSKVAKFSRIPADIFRAYTIRSWGHGQPGAAWAELDGAPPLYSIHVASAGEWNATSLSPVKELFGHWQQEARREFATARNQISARMGVTGNAQGSAHIKLLCNAAESSVLAMLTQARALPISPDSYAIALTSSRALLEELGASVLSTAIGANGRSPTPQNAPFVDKLIREATARIETEIVKWRLEDRIANSGAPVSQKVQKGPSATASGEPNVKNPRLPEPKLIKWWRQLPASERAKSLDTLLELCREAFPSNSISRQRIRDLDPGRKRGPKPISGKATA